MGIKSIVMDLDAKVLGNRVTSLGAVLLTTNIILNSTIKNYNDFAEEGLLAGGMACLGLTLLGTHTLKSYKRTKKHIKQYGTLSQNYFQNMIDGGSNGLVCGYCELQGVYLAARNFGLKKEFKELKYKFSNCIIPNF